MLIFVDWLFCAVHYCFGLGGELLIYIVFNEIYNATFTADAVVEKIKQIKKN